MLEPAVPEALTFDDVLLLPAHSRVLPSQVDTKSRLTRAITLNDSPGPVTRVMALLWEAKIEHARGNKAKAELWAKKALREDPTFAEAEEFLTQLAETP